MTQILCQIFFSVDSQILVYSAVKRLLLLFDLFGEYFQSRRTIVKHKHCDNKKAGM